MKKLPKLDLERVAWLRGFRGRNKKIIGEYFRENRKFGVLTGGVAEAILPGGEIESKRQSRADEFMQLQKNQIESRKKMFAPLNIDFPLPVVSREDWLTKIAPPDAWSYSQYGAIFDEDVETWEEPDDVVEETLPRISIDATDLITKLVIEKMTMAQIISPESFSSPEPVSGKEKLPDFPPRKREEPAPRKSGAGESSVSLEKKDETTPAPSRADDADDPDDLLAARRRKAARMKARKQKRRRRERLFIFFSLFLFLLAASTAVWRIFFRG